jgi:tetratricopeptide (TPR) repeat protein
MRWISVLALLLVLSGSSRAAGPDDMYLDIYNEILQADNLQQSGHPKEASAKYLEAQTSLKSLKQGNPAWNTAVVDFRLDYLSEQLQATARQMAAIPAPPPQAAAPVRPAAPPQAAAPAQSVAEVASLREQVRSLAAANAELENKLKEALSVQPAAVSPRELAKAQEKLTTLQKENDLLSVALEQAKAAKPSSAPFPAADKTARQLADANEALADAQKKIATDAVEIAALKAASVPDTSAREIAAERDKLKDELAARTKDLAEAEAHRDPSVAEVRAQLAQVEQQRDELKAKLAAAPSAAPAAADAQTDQLRARLAVLEAQAVPYTPEELALMKTNPAAPTAQLPVPPAAVKHVVHSMKDLPPGAGALMTEAGRAVMERDYPKAAGKYEEILHQDPNNVYVLAYLANAQFAMNQTDECEKTVTHALALDPEDPACLYLLGILRYRQEKLDEALNALSLSAKYNPTNAGTQNYLGRVLADKGQRAAAETAFRKALVSDPAYPDAHFRLAIIYASEKPPSLELARWHYNRALDLGHDKNAELEKLLGPAP